MVGYFILFQIFFGELWLYTRIEFFDFLRAMIMNLTNGLDKSLRSMDVSNNHPTLVKRHARIISVSGKALVGLMALSK